MRVQRTRTKQLRAPLTTTLGHPKIMQRNFNSCSFNYKSDYKIVNFLFIYLFIYLSIDCLTADWSIDRVIIFYL